MGDGNGESPDEKMKRLSVIYNPNYELPEYSPLPLPFEFQDQLEARAEGMPPPETVIGPFQSGSWGIIAASPGVGKSMWIACLLRAICGKDQTAGAWTAPKRRTALLIDAEMSPIELAERYQFADMGDWFGVCSLDLLDRCEHEAFSLGNPEHQAALFAAGENFEVIVVDNIEYTLEPAEGHSIWAPETWAQVAPITRWAKQNNKLLVFVDHLNKDHNVQGSLSKQRGASFVVRLQPEYVERSDLAFRASFQKLRYLVAPELKRQTLWWFEENEWWCEIEETPLDQVKSLMREGAKQSEIVKETGLSKGYVSKIYRRNKHLLE